MNKHYPQILVLITVLLAVAAAPAGAQVLLPAGAGDLAAEALVSAPRHKAADAPRDAVTFSRTLDPSVALAGRSEPFVSRSKEYFVDVTAQDLRDGVPLYTTAPGALVRLNPAGRNGETATTDKAAIEPASLVLTAADGKAYGGGSGMDLIVGPEQLKAAGAPFVEGTSAFRIREDLGAGTFELRADGLAAKSERRFVVHVLDRGSAVELELRTTATDYLHGQTLVVEARLAGATRVRATQIEGFVSSPAGRAWPLELRRGGDGLYTGSLVLDAIEAPAPGLWEAHVSAQGLASGHAVLRAGRTAFGCTAPGARFAGDADVTVSAGKLAVSLAVETAAPSRYEARGVLYATADDGSLRPAALSHHGAWLEAGSGFLELSFDPTTLADQGLGAPFEVRDLRLVDQVSMGLLHRQERALAFDR